MSIQEPSVYRAVRAVGTLKPKFQPSPQGKIFADQLDVRGTAFWIKDYGILVTCAHVVQDLVVAPVEVTGLLVVGNRGEYLRATVGMVDFDHDLAVLRLPLDVPKEVFEKEKNQGLEIANNDPNVGQPVAYVGFPLGVQLLNSTHAPTYAEGVVGAQLRHHGVRKNIQITGPVTGGFSGGPVVKRETNELVGVLSNSPSEKAGNAGIFMAVSWAHVRALANLASS